MGVRRKKNASPPPNAGGMPLPVISERQFKSHGLTTQQRRAVTYCSAKLFSHRLCRRPPFLKLIRITTLSRPDASSLPKPELLWSATACPCFKDPRPEGQSLWDQIQLASQPTRAPKSRPTSNCSTGDTESSPGTGPPPP